MRRRVGILLALVAWTASTVLVGCAEDPPANPRSTLVEAKRQLDTTRTVHFRVTSAGLPEAGAVLVGGDGVAKRPAAFAGRFRVATGGVALTLQVVSLDGTLYAQIPFTERFAATDPDRLGIADPALMLDPGQGLSSFLTDAKRVRHVGRARSGREVVTQVSARLPAKVVGRLLVVADPRATFETNFFVAEDTGQLRKATFRGPFYGKKSTTTYTVVLDRYGEPATITKPHKGA
ncbi:LppX_LprAFG lipoprotein [Actinopolymorpha sp. B11F2]|uniref:LppX_LprAFG lipoprotein n=1 Tax=Actinopolymorpha sp. B11F2 TaxID=3160862 RepID=UPI0032E3EA34